MGQLTNSAKHNWSLFCSQVARFSSDHLPEENPRSSFLKKSFERITLGIFPLKETTTGGTGGPGILIFAKRFQFESSLSFLRRVSVCLLWTRPGSLEAFMSSRSCASFPWTVELLQASTNRMNRWRRLSEAGSQVLSVGAISWIHGGASKSQDLF